MQGRVLGLCVSITVLDAMAARALTRSGCHAKHCFRNARLIASMKIPAAPPLDAAPRD